MFGFHLSMIFVISAFIIPSFSVAQNVQRNHTTVKSLLLSYMKRGTEDNSSIRDQKTAFAVEWTFGKKLVKYDKVVDKYVEFQPDGSWRAILTGKMLEEWKEAGYPGQTYELWRFHKYGGKGYIRSEAIKEIKRNIEDFKKTRDNKYFECAEALEKYLKQNMENDEALKALLSEYYLKEFGEHLMGHSQAIKLVPGCVE